MEIHDNTKKQTISDIITTTDIESWELGANVVISAPCGRGKSFFIKNKLYEHAKGNSDKILFLIHRKQTKKQFIKELKKDKETYKLDVIEFMTYQKIENAIKHDYVSKLNLDMYKYIVVDEFHYFLSDCEFNHFTDLSYKLIMNQESSIKILMSATGDKMKRIIEKSDKIETISYDIENDFSFINKLEFYYDDEFLDEYIEQAYQNQQKTIFFINKTKRLKHFYNKYQHVSTLNCSENHKLYELVDQTKIETMLEDERFNSLFMFTTTVMDAGLNLIDDELSNIVIDVGIDIDTIIQCIGRKRLTETSNKVNVLLKTYSNQSLGGIESELAKKTEHANYFFINNKDVDAYTKHFNRKNDKYDLVYTSQNDNGETVLMLNELRYLKLSIIEFKVKYKFKEYKSEHNFCEYVSDCFGGIPYTILDVEKEVTEKEKKVMELEQYLNYLYENDVRLVTKIKDDLSDKFEYSLRDELINTIGEISNDKRMKSITKLNHFISGYDLPYLISSKKSKDIRYWTVGRIYD